MAKWRVFMFVAFPPLKVLCSWICQKGQLWLQQCACRVIPSPRPGIPQDVAFSSVSGILSLSLSASGACRGQPHIAGVFLCASGGRTRVGIQMPKQWELRCVTRCLYVPSPLRLLTEEQSLAWKAWHACLTHVYVNPIHHLCACARWGNTQLRGCLFLPCRTCVQCLFLTACPHLTSSYTAFHFSACSVCDCLFSLLLMKVWTPNAFLSGWSSASSVWHNVINSAAMALFIGLVNLPEPMSGELGFWLQGSQWDSSLLWLHFGFVRNRPNLPLWQELGFSDAAMLCIADLWPWWHSAGRYLQVDF